MTFERFSAAFRRSTQLLGMLALIALHAAGARADDAEVRFFDRLLERGLVRVAENEALRRLDDPLLKPAGKVQWTVRLARAYARHAELTAEPDRSEFLERSESLLNVLQQSGGAGIRGAEVATELAFLRHRQAELLLWSIEVESVSPPLAERATAALREAIKKLREAREFLNEQAGGASRAGERPEGELSAAELRQLQRDVELRLAEALVDLGELLPTGPARQGALAEAGDRLRELSDGWIGDMRTWEARLLRVRLARIEGDHARSLQLVESSLQDQPAGWLEDRFVAEFVRTQLAAGRSDEALQRLLEHGRARSSLSDELKALAVEALLAGRRVARQGEDNQTAEELWARAEAFAQQTTGGWRARADALLQRERQSTQYGPEAAALVRSAKSSYQAGDIEQALQQFQQARDVVLAAGQPAAADEFDYTRGSILVERKRFDEAARVLGELLTRSPNSTHAADAGLLRAYALGQLLQANPGKEGEERFVAALEEHRTQFAGKPSGVEATWMLATFEESREQWSRAVPLYLEIADDSPRAEQAQLRVARLYERVLERLGTNRETTLAWEDQALRVLGQFAASYPDAAADLSLIQAEVLLALGRLQLRRVEPDYDEASGALRRVAAAHAARRRASEQQESTPDREWERLGRSAARLWIVALAGQGRLSEARALFEQLAVSEPQALLEILSGLQDLSDRIPEEQRTALAHLQLDAARLFDARRDKLTAAQQRDLNLIRAEAYLASGNLVDAAALFEAALKEAPHDAALLRQAADLLSAQETPEQLARAQTYWRRLEGTQTKGNPDWLETRLRLAETSLKLGQAQEARKLIALTRLLYPQLGGGELKRRYEDLERRLPSPSPGRSQP